MAEVARLVGAEDVQVLEALGTEGLPAARPADLAAAAPVRPWWQRLSASLAVPAQRSEASGSVLGEGAGGVEALLIQLRQEPSDEAECAAKFMLYEGYASEVEQMRNTLLKLHEESRPTVPSAVATGMDRDIKGIDSRET